MKRSRLLTRLWEFQDEHGFISDNAISEISQKLHVSKIEIEGVISFYHFFHRKPTGKYIIYLNNSIISEFKGFAEVKSAFEKETSCTFGDYGSHQLFSLFETSCIGLSDQEPAALINFYPFTDLNPEKVKWIIDELKNGKEPEDLADNPVSRIQYTPDEEKTVFFRPHEAGSVLKTLKQFDRKDVLESIKQAQLAGRGGAFFPTGMKWEFCMNSEHEKKYVICNADEGEPGTFKDKALLSRLPELILEGMIIAGYITGAQHGFIYLRAEYRYLKPKLEKVLNEYYQNGYLGNHCCGMMDFNFDIEIELGAGAYVCGAETALIESLEGKRGEPRIRKYFPTDYGFEGHSTIVNNVETFAMASRIIELGPEYIQGIGTSKSFGTKLLSLSGDIARPGIYEIEWGMTVQELLDECQATGPHYIQISGPSGECINKADFERKICKEDLVCGGSVMVFNKFRSIIQILENFTKFFKEESCGTCTPCRAGNQILHEKIKKLKSGICTKADLDEVKEWAKIIEVTSRCGLGQLCANSFVMAIDKFAPYFDLKIIDDNKDANVEFDMENAVFEYDHLIKTTQNQHSEEENIY